MAHAGRPRRCISGTTRAMLYGPDTPTQQLRMQVAHLEVEKEANARFKAELLEQQRRLAETRHALDEEHEALNYARNRRTRAEAEPYRTPKAITDLGGIEIGMCGPWPKTNPKSDRN